MEMVRKQLKGLIHGCSSGKVKWVFDSRGAKGLTTSSCISRRGILKGIIEWFNNSKGYGFIGREDGPDVFVHYSGILGDGYRTLQEGDFVEFDIVQGSKGPQAGNVRKVVSTNKGN
jgi:cold shock protein